MKMEDVNEFDMNNVKPIQESKQNISDDEFIRNSLEAQRRGKPVQENKPVMREQIMYPSLTPVEDDVIYFKIKKIPSRGVLYPEGTEITARPLKTIEAKKLSTINDDNADYVINDILRKCVKGIKVEDIYVADKLAILLWLRSESFPDPRFQVDYHCDKCETDSSFHFGYNNIDIQYLPDDYDPAKSIKVLNGDSIRLKFLTIGENERIEKTKQSYKGSMIEMDSEMITVAGMIQDVNGERMSLFDKYNYLSKDPQVYSMIVSYLEKYGMGVLPLMNVTCDKCGGDSQLAITFHRSFMFPSYRF